MHEEDKSVNTAMNLALKQITRASEAAFESLQSDGRLFYLGAGTSGRLGVVDASECPPTFGVDHGVVIGIMAGGDGAIRKAVEFAEDDTEQGFLDLEAYDVSAKDMVIGISASGRTPYVLGALQKCKENGIKTGCVVCNNGSKIAESSDYPVEVITGPEYITGSTRLKAGTATKLVLNMITTSSMIRLGHVKGNKMVDMQLSNDKLIDRGTRMVMEETGIDYTTAQTVLLKEGSVRKAVDKLLQY
jgi:N-acetylmuramic acid 6-phosphate etherase